MPASIAGQAPISRGVRGLGRLPVVARENPQHLVGLIRRQDIIRAYDLALTRRSEIQQRSRLMQRRAQDGMEFVELTLVEDDGVVGRSVAEFARKMPEVCILVSIRRNGRVIIPHGDTVFEPGDHVTAYVQNEDVERLVQCFHQPQTALIHLDLNA